MSRAFHVFMAPPRRQVLDALRTRLYWLAGNDHDLRPHIVSSEGTLLFEAGRDHTYHDELVYAVCRRCRTLKEACR